MQSSLFLWWWYWWLKSAAAASAALLFACKHSSYYQLLVRTPVITYCLSALQLLPIACQHSSYYQLLVSTPVITNCLSALQLLTIACQHSSYYQLLVSAPVITKLYRTSKSWRRWLFLDTLTVYPANSWFTDPYITHTDEKFKLWPKFETHTLHWWQASSSSYSVFPSYNSPVHHFGWDFCVCDRF